MYDKIVKLFWPWLSTTRLFACLALPSAFLCLLETWTDKLPPLPSHFYGSVFSNHVTPPDELVALGKFQQASGCINMVGLSDACSYTQAGEKVS